MRTSLLALFLLTACHQASTPEDQLNRAADAQRRIAASPPDGKPADRTVSIDHDSATPTPADRAR